MNTSTIPNTGSTHQAAAIEDNAAEIRSALGAAAESEVVKLTGNQTVAGNKTMTGQFKMPNQAASAADDGMTRGLCDARYPRVLYSSGVKASRPATVSTHTLASVTIPANSMGPNGWLEVRFLVTGLNTATVGTRYNTVQFDGVAVKQHTATAGLNYNISQDLIIHNRNAANSQIMASRADRADFIWGQYTGVGPGGDAGSMALSVDTSQNKLLTITNTSIDAADTAFLQFLQVIAHYAP